MNIRFLRQLIDFKEGQSDDLNAYAFDTLNSIGILNEIELSINLKFDWPLLVDYEGEEKDNWTRSRKYYELGVFHVKARTDDKFDIVKADTAEKLQPGYLQTKVNHYTYRILSFFNVF